MATDPGHPIKVVSRRTGLSPHLIRIWERRYRAVVPQRTSTNRRLYADSDIERLLLLHRAVRAGRSIGSVAHLSFNELQSLVAQDEAKGFVATPGTRRAAVENSPEHFIELSLAAIRELNADQLDTVLRQASVMLSQPVLIEQVIVPLMYRIGDLWREGNCRVVHEHIASSVVRNFLGNLKTAYAIAPNAPVAIFTTPSGHLHEFGALIAAATAASEGWNAIYLGPNLPVEEIALIARKRQARVIGLSLVYPPDDPHLHDDLVALRKLLPEETSVLIGGLGAPNYEASIVKIKATLIRDLLTLRNCLEQIRRKSSAVKHLN